MWDIQHDQPLRNTISWRIMIKTTMLVRVLQKPWPLSEYLPPNPLVPLQLVLVAALAWRRHHSNHRRSSILPFKNTGSSGDACFPALIRAFSWIRRAGSVSRRNRLRTTWRRARSI